MVTKVTTYLLGAAMTKCRVVIQAVEFSYSFGRSEVLHDQVIMMSSDADCLLLIVCANGRNCIK